MDYEGKMVTVITQIIEEIILCISRVAKIPVKDSEIP